MKGPIQSLSSVDKIPRPHPKIKALQYEDNSTFDEQTQDWSSTNVMPLCCNNIRSLSIPLMGCACIPLIETESDLSDMSPFLWHGGITTILNIELA